MTAVAAADQLTKARDWTANGTVDVFLAVSRRLPTAPKRAGRLSQIGLHSTTDVVCFNCSWSPPCGSASATGAVELARNLAVNCPATVARVRDDPRSKSVLSSGRASSLRSSVPSLPQCSSGLQQPVWAPVDGAYCGQGHRRSIRIFCRLPETFEGSAKFGEQRPSSLSGCSVLCLSKESMQLH